MKKQDSSGSAPAAVPASTVIEASGQTDDIRYVLNAEPQAELAQPADSEAAGNDAAAGNGTGGGLANLVIDDADGELPDRTASTIAGGQVAKESKRGAY